MQKEHRTHQEHTNSNAEQMPSPLANLLAALNHEAAAPIQRTAPAAKAPPQPTAEDVPEGVYIISVAARMLAMHPQTLRKYERVGLIRPSRTVGMLRLYSEEDVAKLRVIRYLVEELRLNLAGVEVVISMVDRLSALRSEMGPRHQAAVRSFERAMEEILTMLQGGHPKVVRSRGTDDD